MGGLLGAEDSQLTYAITPEMTENGSKPAKMNNNKLGSKAQRVCQPLRTPETNTTTRGRPGVVEQQEPDGRCTIELNKPQGMIWCRSVNMASSSPQ
jgi:hypothetical protein